MATEIVVLPMKAGTSTEPSSSTGTVLLEVLHTVLAQPGCQRLYFGTGIESPGTGHLLIDWDSVSKHHEFMKSDAYPAFMKQFTSLLDGAPILTHTHFTPHPPSAALSNVSSPVTEVLKVYFPADYSSADMAKFEADLTKLTDAIGSAAKSHAGGWMDEEVTIPGTEDKGKAFIAVVGWESVDAHMQCRETEIFKSNIGGLRNAKDLKKIEVGHVSFTEMQQSG